MPMYVDIANILRDEIAADVHPVGTMLPGITALQERFGGVSLNTIRGAESILQEEGLIEVSQGKGAKVIAKPQPDPFTLLETIKTATNQLETLLKQQSAR